MKPQPFVPDANAPEMRPGLSWGVKQSFNRYVDASPDGQRDAGIGATQMPDGTYFFEFADASDFDPQAGTGVIKYLGAVRYKAHGGVLFVVIAEPWLEFNDGSAELSVIHPEAMQERDRRLSIATLDVQNAQQGLPLGWNGLQAHITQAGVDLFNNVYAPGEAVDPVRFSFMTPVTVA